MRRMDQPLVVSVDTTGATVSLPAKLCMEESQKQTNASKNKTMDSHSRDTNKEIMAAAAAAAASTSNSNMDHNKNNAATSNGYLKKSSSMYSEDDSKSSAVLAVWVKRLITPEDPFHLHKTLGVLSLASIVWRLCYSGQADCGFETHKAWTLPTLLLHLLLNSTAFQFVIPSRRITTGYRIWPEYRLHSFVFTFRACAVMLVRWIQQEHLGQHPQQDTGIFARLLSSPCINFWILLFTVAAADVASWSVGKYQSNMIRDLAVSKSVKFFFSAMQLFATTGILLGQSAGRYTVPFWHIIIVQCNAFLMTIRRKNLASHNQLIFVYGVGLTMGLVGSVVEYVVASSTGDLRPLLCAMTVGYTAIFLRLGGLKLLFGLLSPSLEPLAVWLNNKYLMWTLLCVWWMRDLKPLLALQDESLVSSSYWYLLGTTSLAVSSAVFLWWYKCCAHKPKCNPQDGGEIEDADIVRARILKVKGL